MKDLHRKTYFQEEECFSGNESCSKADRFGNVLFNSLSQLLGSTAYITTVALARELKAHAALCKAGRKSSLEVEITELVQYTTRGSIAAKHCLTADFACFSNWVEKKLSHWKRRQTGNVFGPNLGRV